MKLGYLEAEIVLDACSRRHWLEYSPLAVLNVRLSRLCEPERQPGGVERR
jgi:hypothetical protein